MHRARWASLPLAAQYFTINPLAERMDTMGRSYLRKQVDDPATRDKLTPRYAVGCKRPASTTPTWPRSTATTSG